MDLDVYVHLILQLFKMLQSCGFLVTEPSLDVRSLQATFWATWQQPSLSRKISKSILNTAAFQGHVTPPWNSVALLYHWGHLGQISLVYTRNMRMTVMCSR